MAMGQRGFLILGEALLDSPFSFRTSLLVRARKTGRHDDKMRQITTKHDIHRLGACLKTPGGGCGEGHWSWARRCWIQSSYFAMRSLCSFAADIRVHPCPSVVKWLLAFYSGFQFLRSL